MLLVMGENSKCRFPLLSPSICYDTILYALALEPAVFGVTQVPIKCTNPPPL